MEFEPLYQLPNAWTLAAGRLGVHFFEGEVTVEEMDQMELLAADWHRKNPGRTVEPVVIYPSSHRMSGAERRRMVALMKRWEGVRDASCTVTLAQGLVGSLHRRILTGLMMLAPSPHPVKVHASIPAGLEFLAPYVAALGGPREMEPLTAAVEALQRRFGSRTDRRGPD